MSKARARNVEKMAERTRANGTKAANNEVEKDASEKDGTSGKPMTETIAIALHGEKNNRVGGTKTTERAAKVTSASTNTNEGAPTMGAPWLGKTRSAQIRRIRSPIARSLIKQHM